MEISEELRKFTWIRFERMKLESIRLKRERKTYKEKKERDRKKQKPVSMNYIKEITKGKSDFDFNTWLCMIYYRIKEETGGRDASIYNWLKEFLENQDYKMQDEKSYYDNDAIRQRIRDHWKKIDQETRESFKVIFDSIYDDFHKRPHFESNDF